MALQEKILSELEKQRGAFVSGEELARRAGVSRAAVWKAISALRARMEIESVPSRGYRLGAGESNFSAAGVTGLLENSAKSRFQVEVRPQVVSTNAELKTRAQQGAPAGSVLCAAEQTQGRGRMGRPFYSPDGTGIYLSVLLRPKMPLADALFITTSAAVAVCTAVESINSSANAQVKWVNDVFVGEKKICGILTEAAVDFESGGLDYAVLGIGLNLYEPAGGFPPEAGNAGGAFSRTEPNIRNRTAAAILNELARFGDDFRAAGILDEYRRRSFLPGRRVVVVSAKGERQALALSVDENARLVVRYEDGTTEAVSSGEVRVRAAND